MKNNDQLSFILNIQAVVPDWGNSVRNMQKRIALFAEHILDWFHAAMRITVLKQMSNRFLKLYHLKDLQANLDRAKWYLWHGNVYKAIQQINWLEIDLEAYDLDETGLLKQYRTLIDKMTESYGYIKNNAGFIPCYVDRYHYGEMISTAFIESAVNEIVSRRLVKKQQIRWTKKGDHLLLQVRTRTLNDELHNAFERWYRPRSLTRMSCRWSLSPHFLLVFF